MDVCRHQISFRVICLLETDNGLTLPPSAFIELIRSPVPPILTYPTPLISQAGHEILYKLENWQLAAACVSFSPAPPQESRTSLHVELIYILHSFLLRLRLAQDMAFTTSDASKKWTSWLTLKRFRSQTEIANSRRRADNPSSIPFDKKVNH